MADEYIRKQDAVDACGKEYPPNTDFERGMICQMVGDKVRIERLQPADVVPVVRCGQCGYWHDNDGDYGYCYAKDGQGFGHAWRKNDFCSYGERKGKYEID